MATAYATLAQANEWFDARKIGTWAEYDPDEREAVLLRASEWIDRYFVFAGARANPDQDMAWPRVNLPAHDGRDAAAIPAAVHEAVFSLALAMLDDDESAEAAIGLGPVIAGQKAGGVEISYDNAGRRAASRIEQLLKPYLAPLNSHSVPIRRC